MRVRAKRLGWNETEADTVTATDILDPYDYPAPWVEGELEVREATGPFIKPYTQYTVAGQPVRSDDHREMTHRSILLEDSEPTLRDPWEAFRDAARDLPIEYGSVRAVYQDGRLIDIIREERVRVDRTRLTE